MTEMDDEEDESGAVWLSGIRLAIRCRKCMVMTEDLLECLTSTLKGWRTWSLERGAQWRGLQHSLTDTKGDRGAGLSVEDGLMHERRSILKQNRRGGGKLKREKKKKIQLS